MVTFMRYIRDLNPETKKLLERISYQSKFPQVRDRAKCILLSSNKFPVKKLMSIFNVGRKTIYNWLTRWEDQKIRGLYNQKGRGRKPKLNQQQREQVKALVKSEPKSWNKVRSEIHRMWEIDISKETIKRIVKNLNMIWKRMKRGMSKSPDEWELMDQASIHTSDKIIEKLDEWKTRNLEIFWLPTYSPKQNLIEILWKFVKYEWIEVSAYESWNNFLNYLRKVLDNFGKEYVINFV